MNSRNINVGLGCRSARWFAGAALVISTLGIFATPFVTLPVKADEVHNKIASTIMNLQSSKQRWIQIDVKRQRLYAWEGNKQVLALVISTGKKGFETPPGTFNIQSKHVFAKMEGEDYNVPDVPFTMYYHNGYAIHGAYWHNNFGTPVSHGCTNLAVDRAEWLFNWAEVGTPVIVHN
ncbi:L,D-transpeptidase [Ancylothrix sp. C2]|uniref:L,D-transpeptidase n=1 Tax=Ancylothrix sp. D3o TaxID=2953691 RepID=UPI0021BAB9AE|nr:L,D-transpeptidase [Ancylothrix sp. D3o]MCT7951113.1 L,D-transpeptidase [Ancylothrix sp. D3o]